MLLVAEERRFVLFVRSFVQTFVQTFVRSNTFIQTFSNGDQLFESGRVVCCRRPPVTKQWSTERPIREGMKRCRVGTDAREPVAVNLTNHLSFVLGVGGMQKCSAHAQSVATPTSISQVMFMCPVAERNCS